LADHVKNLDWWARSAKRKGRVSDAELAEVRGKLRALIGSWHRLQCGTTTRQTEISAGGFGMIWVVL
jgi:hypothetical protein